MKHIVVITIFSILLATPLECMHKMCPHQTLYTTAQQNKSHPLHKLLDDTQSHPELQRLIGQGEDLGKFKVFVKKVFLNAPISYRLTQDCLQCYPEEHKLFQKQKTDFVERLDNMLVKNDLQASIEETETFLKSFPIMKQLFFLFHMQQGSLYEQESREQESQRFIANMGRSTAIPALMVVLIILWMGCEKGLQVIFTGCDGLLYFYAPLIGLVSGILGLSTLAILAFAIPSPVFCLMTAITSLYHLYDSKNDRKLKLLDHCIREIRRLNQHTSEHSQVAQQARNRYNDIAFSFK